MRLCVRTSVRDAGSEPTDAAASAGVSLAGVCSNATELVTVQVTIGDEGSDSDDAGV